MDEELIKRLADESEITCDSLPPWMTDYGYSKDSILKFAALVAEECAKECEAYAAQSMGASCDGALGSAAAIRAKFPPAHE